MVNVIENNAYRILGLDVIASQKDILRRYKDIINRLKIEDIPEYELDYKLSEKMRTETEVDKALKKLQSYKINIIEFFFWFHISDKIDEKAFKQIKDNEIPKAIQIWEKSSETQNSRAYLYKKNLAILYCLALLENDKPTYVKKSLELWKEIIESDKFWFAFLKIYSMNNDLITNSNNIDGFKKDVPGLISDVYTDISKRYKKPQYVKDFQKMFNTYGKETEKKVLTPAIESMYIELEKLRKFKLDDNKDDDENEVCDICGQSDSGFLSILGLRSFWLCDNGAVLCDKCKDISKKSCKKIDDLDMHEKKWRKMMKGAYEIIRLIERKIDNLYKIGLYDNSQSKIVRDRVAEVIRLLAVSLYNKSFLHEDSIKLIKIALKICGTESMKKKLESDIQAIKKIKKDDKKNSSTLNLSNGDTIKFTGNYLEYNNKKIIYDDIEQVSYMATSHSVYGIKTSTSCEFSLASTNDGFSLSFDEDKWQNLIGISKQLIEPIIIRKIVEKIFKKKIKYAIGEVTLDKDGYSVDKSFRGTDKVKWSDKIFIPQYVQGQVILFKEEKQDNGKQFAAIKMDEPNAVVLPELIMACVDTYYLYQ